MKNSAIYLVACCCLIGCSSSPTYNTVKTARDQYTVTGPDPNQLKGNAYKACRDDGFDDYSVVESNRNGMTVRCEKNTAGFFSTATEKASAVWDAVKQKVDNLRTNDNTNQR